MKSFAVRCPVPEVFDMLQRVAEANGYHNPHGTFGDYKRWFWAENREVVGGNCSDRELVRDGELCGRPIISIEAAIAELQKPREKPITIGGHEAKFPGDGSVIIGGTTVTAEQADEIEKRRKMKSDGWRYFVNSSGVLLKYLASEGDRAAVRGFGLAMNGWFGNNYNLSEYQGTDRNEITEAEARDKFPAAFTEAQ